MPKKAYVIGLFDLHSGHKLGLLNPKTRLMETGPQGQIEWKAVSLNAYQNYLWDDIYVPAVGAIKTITGDDDIILIVGGDIQQGNRHPEQTFTLSEYNQVVISTDALDPLVSLPNCKCVRMAAGTGAHDFTEHSGTLLATHVLSLRYPEKDIAANYQGVASVLGYTIDYAHHGPGEGLRIYLNGNNARYYATDLLIRCLSLHKKPPDLIWRGHVHGDQDETVKMGDYSVRIQVIPSMCGMSFFGRKVTRSRFIVPNGFVMAEITDGKLTRDWKFIRRDDVRTEEVLL